MFSPSSTCPDGLLPLLHFAIRAGNSNWAQCSCTYTWSYTQPYNLPCLRQSPCIVGMGSFKVSRNWPGKYEDGIIAIKLLVD